MVDAERAAGADVELVDGGRQRRRREPLRQQLGVGPPVEQPLARRVDDAREDEFPIRLLSRLLRPCLLSPCLLPNYLVSVGAAACAARASLAIRRPTSSPPAPSRNRAPTILSMSMNMQNALPMKLLWPVMVQVTFVCSPLRLERELGGVRRGERLEELEPDANQVARPALGDRHAALRRPPCCRPTRRPPRRPRAGLRRSASSPGPCAPTATTPPTCGSRSPARTPTGGGAAIVAERVMRNSAGRVATMMTNTTMRTARTMRILMSMKRPFFRLIDGFVWFRDLRSHLRHVRRQAVEGLRPPFVHALEVNVGRRRLCGRSAP